MDGTEIKQKITQGQTVLGIEFGSTRIKSVLIDARGHILAAGAYSWHSQLRNGLWTYSLTEVEQGLVASYHSLKQQVINDYGVKISRLRAIGISAMMHGLIALDENDHLLAPFRTWENTNAKKAGALLSPALNFHIPERWSVAQLYQSVLDKDPFVRKVKHIFTLASFLHYRLTGRRVIGLDDASGMFPINSRSGNYDERMLNAFDNLLTPYHFDWQLRDLLPRPLIAGQKAGTLTKKGAKLIDPSGDLQAGIPLCPPEGDEGTGMVATNMLAAGQSNISVGTSIFMATVLSKPLKHRYNTVDVVMTPNGHPAAMIHCNNCSSDLNGWVNLFRDFVRTAKLKLSTNDIYRLLFEMALKSDPSADGTVTCNYEAGEPLTGFSQGVPLLLRYPGHPLRLANLMRANLYGAFVGIRLGLDSLAKKEAIVPKLVTAQGGLFLTPKVAQQLLADSLGIPVKVNNSPNKDGAWAIALLALYMVDGQSNPLHDWLTKKISSHDQSKAMKPTDAGQKGFKRYLQNYQQILRVERSAVRNYVSNKKEDEKNE